MLCHHEKNASLPISFNSDNQFAKQVISIVEDENVSNHASGKDHHLMDRCVPLRRGPHEKHQILLQTLRHQLSPVEL